MKQRLCYVLLTLVCLSGCSLPSAGTPAPTPTLVPALVFAATPTSTPLAALAPTVTPVPAAARTVCSDPQVPALLDALKSAILLEQGDLLGSLVSPNGIEVRYFHNGAAVNYSAYQAQFLFETTYEASWGNDPASGIEKRGSFHEVIVPALRQFFATPYTQHCNTLEHGGASYPVDWQYPGDFYSLYFAGTEQNGSLDWNTWVAGVEYVDGKPYLYALTQFYWEP